MAKLFPLFFAALLSSIFFMSIVLLDKVMEKSIAPYLRITLSHLILLCIIVVAIYLLPGEWGLNLKNWQKSLILGSVLGISLGIIFSLFLYRVNILHWNFVNLIVRLKDKQNLILLLTQLLVVGTTEELFFRGILMTYFMKQYSVKIAGLHIAVLVVALMFGGIHFYKLFFGVPLKNILPYAVGGSFYGMLLGWVYQNTGSLLGLVILHNLCNSCMFLIRIGI